MRLFILEKIRIKRDKKKKKRAKTLSKSVKNQEVVTGTPTMITFRVRVTTNE